MNVGVVENCVTKTLFFQKILSTQQVCMSGVFFWVNLGFFLFYLIEKYHFPMEKLMIKKKAIKVIIFPIFYLNLVFYFNSPFF